MSTTIEEDIKQAFGTENPTLKAINDAISSMNQDGKKFFGAKKSQVVKMQMLETKFNKITTWLDETIDNGEEFDKAMIKTSSADIYQIYNSAPASYFLIDAERADEVMRWYEGFGDRLREKKSEVEAGEAYFDTDKMDFRGIELEEEITIDDLKETLRPLRRPSKSDNVPKPAGSPVVPAKLPGSLLAASSAVNKTGVASVSLNDRVAKLLNDFTYQIEGSSVTTVLDTFIGLNDSDEDISVFVAACLFSCMTTSKALEEKLILPDFAAARRIIASSFSLNGKMNFTAISILGHVLIHTFSYPGNSFVRSIRTKIGGAVSIWKANINTCQFSDVQRKIIGEKIQISTRDMADKAAVILKARFPSEDVNIN